MSAQSAPLRASVILAGAPGASTQVLLDGADTPVTANGLSNYSPTPGDRLLVQLVGTQVEVIQYLSRGTVPYLVDADLNAVQIEVDDALATLQTSFDVLSGVGTAGVVEDYLWVGDDPSMSTVKSVQISPYVQGNLYAGDPDSFADAFGLYNANDLGDLVYVGRDSPMTTFYKAFASVGLAAMPFNR